MLPCSPADAVVRYNFIVVIVTSAHLLMRLASARPLAPLQESHGWLPLHQRVVNDLPETSCLALSVQPDFLRPPHQDVRGKLRYR